MKQKKAITGKTTMKMIGLVFVMLFATNVRAETYSCQNIGCIYPDVTFMISKNGNVISLQEEGQAAPYTYQRKSVTDDVYWRVTSGRYSNRIYLVLGRGAFRYHENATYESGGKDQIFEKRQTCQ